MDQTRDHRPQTTDHGPRTTDHGAQTADAGGAATVEPLVVAALAPASTAVLADEPLALAAGGNGGGGNGGGKADAGTPAPPAPQSWGEPGSAAPATGSVPAAPVAAVSVPPAPIPGGGVTDGLNYITSVLQQVQQAGLPAAGGPAPTPAQQMAALQVSTALNLLMAGANMLLMYGGSLGQVPAAPSAPAIPAGAEAGEPLAGAPAAAEPAPTQVEAAAPAAPEAPVEAETPAPIAHLASPIPHREITSAAIALPASFSVPGEKMGTTIREVTLGGSGTRTSAVTLGGAAALPFRHFEGNTGRRPAVAVEVFDKLPKNYPAALQEAYGKVLGDPSAMARYAVEELGADVISVRLEGAHPDNGDASPEDAARVVESVLKAVGVPLMVTGPAHFEKTNAVLKQVASAFAEENLLLNWAETDNYKTIAAAAMGYGHCVVAQTPIDVNMAKQLNILITNMGLAPERIVVDALTGALGYGLEYTYSVMERIRTAAFTGDPMLAMPMMGTPGYEVAKTKESKAPATAFPLWGPEAERGALLEIATAISLLNAGADMLVLYHPTAVRTVKRKIEEMSNI